MDAKTLKGIAVVAVKDGEKVGSVDELIFNQETRKLLAFRLSRSGFFSSTRQIILMSDVDNIGQDAVMIPNRDVVREESDERDLHGRPELKQLINLRVVTQDGTYVGTLSAIHFDPKTGDMTQLDVGGGDLMHMFRKGVEVPATEVISMGGDVLVIPNRFAPGQAEEETTEGSGEAPEQQSESDRPEPQS